MLLWSRQPGVCLSTKPSQSRQNPLRPGFLSRVPTRPAQSCRSTHLCLGLFLAMSRPQTALLPPFESSSATSALPPSWHPPRDPSSTLSRLLGQLLRQSQPLLRQHRLCQFLRCWSRSHRLVPSLQHRHSQSPRCRLQSPSQLPRHRLSQLSRCRPKSLRLLGHGSISFFRYGSSATIVNLMGRRFGRNTTSPTS